MVLQSKNNDWLLYEMQHWAEMSKTDRFCNLLT